jgi:molecular chaperone IbpA
MTRLMLDEMFDTLTMPARLIANAASTNSTYPPYNIIQATDKLTVVEFAVAGFKEEEVSVVVEQGTLRVSARKQTNETTRYIHKGISARAFEKTFQLAKNVRVERAEYADGVLSVFVVQLDDERSAGTKIPIQRGQRMYLTEGDDIVGTN